MGISVQNAEQKNLKKTIGLANAGQKIKGNSATNVDLPNQQTLRLPATNVVGNRMTHP